jgi:hypothetical protein
MSLRITALVVGLALIGTCFRASAQQQKSINDKSIERIVGTWKIQKILSGKTEVAKNPTSGQWIEFRGDGKYVNNASSIDSGSYRLNENHSVLYLESQVHASSDKSNPKRIVEWEITLDNDLLTMQQRGNEKTGKKSHADKMKYVYVRIEQGSNMLNN